MQESTMAETASTKNRLSAAEIQSLSKKSMQIWLRDAAIDWIIIGLAFTAIALGNNIVLAIPALLVIGNRQHALTVLGHEGAHFALSKSRKINDALADLFAFWAIGLTTSGYRNVHLKHHKHTNTAQDPELAHRAARAPQWDLPVKLSRIIKYCLQDLLGYSLSDYMIIVTFSKPARPSEYLPVALFHIIFAGAFILAGFWWVPLLWYLSLVTSFMMFFRLRTFLEHLGTNGTHRLYLNWWQRQILAPHNIWYHWEHHTYPAIAYHRLPRARTLLPQVPVMSLGSLIAFFDTAPPISSGQVLKEI